MALLKGLLSSTSSPISTKKFPQPKRNSRTIISTIASMSAPNKWRISGDLTLITPHLASAEGFSKKHFQEISCVLRNVVEEDPFEGLELIDTLQRLGIDYHFQEDIEAILHFHHKKHRISTYYKDELYQVSTCFRLIRQEGFNADPDVFSRFMSKEGKFKSEQSRDIRGLMGVYEASQLSMEGEDILDQASEYSAKLLNTWMKNLDHHQARIVGNTLRHPHHKSLPRIMAKDFIHHHKLHNKWVNLLQEQAKVEFEFVHRMQIKEIDQVSKWWKETGLAKELIFARDQPLKWYLWPSLALTNPRLSPERIDITKIISFIYIIDDIYDVHGTLDELTLLTKAISRWDLAFAEKLPDHMKFCFKALDNITNEISCKIYRNHGYNPVDYLRKTWKDLCNAFLLEAKWFASGKLPSAEEYLKNGIISSGMHIVLVHMFFLLGEGLNNESVKLVNANPSIITSAATILRLWDDMGSAQDENQDGKDGSFVECYMKETGCSEETTREHVMKMISNSWKRLNKETLSTSPFSATFRKGCLNLARMVPLMYIYTENHCLPILENHMKSILHDSIAS